MKYLLVLGFLGLSWQLPAQRPENIIPALGTPGKPKVQIAWNRYYDASALNELCKKIADAWPDLAQVSSIGRSYEGREILCLTITNYKQGIESEKPGYYVDGNIHSNEVQAAEVALYIAWFLTESFDKSAFIKQLLNEKVFYIIPTINPDGRDNFFHKPNTTHSPRSGMMPRDDDRDGQVDEDLHNDLDHDGHITQMRRKSKTGRYRIDPNDPRKMVRVPPEQIGDYELLGAEGLDDDGDGDVNEDGIGYYDPNRDWPWGWQPELIQWGAGKFPFFQPETRAVADFIMAHPNIAGAMTYHNTGGMLLRGPGNQFDEKAYSGNDLAVYDALGKVGESILPGYRYINTYKDLYATFGGESDWLHGARGIVAYTGELYTPYYMFNKTGDGWFGNEDDLYKFDKLLLLEDAFVPWQPYDHPQYGLIEIGGFKKTYMRINPGFQLETDAHRNMAFVLYHAYHTPQLSIQDSSIKPLGNGLFQITVNVYNSRLIPTHLNHDLQNKIELPDFITLEGAEVVAGLLVQNLDFNLAEEPQLKTGKTIAIPNIPGMGKVTVRWIVRGKGPYNLKLESKKGGVVRKVLAP